MASTRSARGSQKRTYTDALQLSDQDQDPNIPQRNVDISCRDRGDVKVDIEEDQVDGSGATLVDHDTIGHEAEPRGTDSRDRKIVVVHAIKSEGDASENHVGIYRKAYLQHSATIRTIEARIRTGEYGLGELVQELNQIQHAIDRRVREIGKLNRDLHEQKQSRQECEIMIETLQNL